MKSALTVAVSALYDQAVISAASTEGRRAAGAWGRAGRSYGRYRGR